MPDDKHRSALSIPPWSSRTHLLLLIAPHALPPLYQVHNHHRWFYCSTFLIARLSLVCFFPALTLNVRNGRMTTASTTFKFRMIIPQVLHPQQTVLTRTSMRLVSSPAKPAAQKSPFGMTTMALPPSFGMPIVRLGKHPNPHIFYSLTVSPSSSSRTPASSAGPVMFASDSAVDALGHPPAKRRRAKRTEEERIEYLRSDPYVGQFEAYRVLCASCDKWIRLRPNSTYCSIPWDAHRKSCLAKKM